MPLVNVGVDVDVDVVVDLLVLVDVLVLVLVLADGARDVGDEQQGLALSRDRDPARSADAAPGRGR